MSKVVAVLSGAIGIYMWLNPPRKAISLLSGTVLIRDARDEGRYLGWTEGAWDMAGKLLAVNAVCECVRIIHN